MNGSIPGTTPEPGTIERPAGAVLDKTERPWAITGASGYVGRCLSSRLRRQNVAFRGLYRERTQVVGDAVLGDLEDREALQRLVFGADVVVHLAAYVHRRAETRQEQDECYRANVLGTRLLLDAIGESAPGAFLVYVSSANVYPTSEEPVDESVPPEPRSFYGRTKFEAECAVLEAIGAGTLTGVILRPPLVFGVGGPGNLGRLVAMLRRRVLPVLNGGQNLKSLVPVELLVDAIIGVVSNRQLCSGEIFNVGGAAFTLEHIARVISEELGVRTVRVPLPTRAAKGGATVVDAICRGLRIPAPNLRQLVETYTASTVIADEKIRRIIALAGASEVEVALRETVRSTGTTGRSASSASDAQARHDSLAT